MLCRLHLLKMLQHIEASTIFGGRVPPITLDRYSIGQALSEYEFLVEVENLVRNQANSKAFVRETVE